MYYGSATWPNHAFSRVVIRFKLEFWWCMLGVVSVPLYCGTIAYMLMLASLFKLRIHVETRGWDCANGARCGCELQVVLPGFSRIYWLKAFVIHALYMLFNAVGAWSYYYPIQWKHLGGSRNSQVSKTVTSRLKPVNSRVTGLCPRCLPGRKGSTFFRANVLVI